ncbi:TauD/TfdA family dioxygenase [Pseudonocardia sp. KRD291]|uniref:TauD/TfdA dioxygenase family protein n=1 Tax=Pseudonocardia sp. KRD291 TaxID=2792007 RepID=UPI001C4A23A3|nr:TauD/TfdA family dioxygenase [Pseudonocardia sp. KRD291]MBW0100856.1 TauD/TfdA family dioxygenase [Pseudonocardia sp. KRD291]
MQTVVHEPVGATVTGVSLRNPAPEMIERIRGLLGEHGVLVLPEQPIDDGAFVEFLRGFGDLTFTVGETPVEDFPDLNVVSNVGRTVPPRSTFHVDTSYVRRPPAYTSLRAVEIPARGGETLFTNQYRAYDTLPPELRERLDGRTITHVVTGVDPGDSAETAAEHPVFRRHPVSGRAALYLSTPTRCVAVSGMTPEESAETVAELFAHSTAEGNVFRHAWSPGDVVIWDNACVLHRADHDDVMGDRVMHRGMVAGTDVPAAA